LRLGSIVAEERHAALARMKDEFVSATSHELRTPLTSIMGSLALLAANAAGELPAPTKRMIGIAHANARRLVALVNDILDFDKLVSGNLAFDLVAVNVGAILRECVEANAGFAAEHGVCLAVDPLPESLSVVVDRDRLLQVLTNLVSNAVKFSERDQLVTLGARQDGGRVRISVTDRGRGIPEEFRERIFTRFAQAHETDGRQKSGTGLGLAIVKELVERMGGEVGFDSEVPQGTTFRVELPMPEALPA
jgi:signal transduction histidine kinase